MIAVFDNETDLIAATRAVREKGCEIVDVYTPYAVHGLDEAMGLIAQSGRRAAGRLRCFRLCYGAAGSQRNSPSVRSAANRRQSSSSRTNCQSQRATVSRSPIAAIVGAISAGEISRMTVRGRTRWPAKMTGTSVS